MNPTDSHHRKSRDPLEEHKGSTFIKGMYKQ